MRNSHRKILCFFGTNYKGVAVIVFYIDFFLSLLFFVLVFFPGVPQGTHPGTLYSISGLFGIFKIIIILFPVNVVALKDE